VPLRLRDAGHARRGESRTRRLATVSAIVAVIAVSQLVQVITWWPPGSPLFSLFDFIPLPFGVIPLLFIPLPEPVLPVPDALPGVPLPAPSAAQQVVANPIATATEIAIMLGRFILILLDLRTTLRVLVATKEGRSSFPEPNGVRGHTEGFGPSLGGR
jgi:hypothetical protein